MKILSSNQIRKIDKFHVETKLISHVKLMDIAAKSCFNWINKYCKIKNKSFTILVGNGNNGGDGLALSIILYLHGISVTVYIINISNNFSNEFRIYKNKILKYKIKIYNIYENDIFPVIKKEKNYLIDAIFGIGLNRELNKYWKNFIHYININKTKFESVISIDIPSGIFIEKNNNDFKSIIKADHTLTFQTPKIPFFLPEYENFIGQWHLLDIGWKNEYLKNIHTKNYFLDNIFIKKIIKKRKKFSHKGNYGHGIIIGGSYGMIGSMILSGKASIRCGIGKLTMYVPYCGYQIIQSTVPEAILKTDKKKYFINNNNITIPYDIKAIGIGMGIGTNINTIYALESFLLKCKKEIPMIPMVIDADAINILSKKQELLSILPKNVILTPHPKEFYRLFGKWKNDYNKLSLLRKISEKYKIFLILKGAHTIISTPDGILYFNSTGNPGLSTAGSGDVLSGIIVSFLSQGYSLNNSCAISVYLHGLSGDIAKKQLGEESIISTDIIDNIPNAFQKI
ncbi:NAD(P)H-hydrate dehydratase [Blattabacterium cuenoti]|uniref:NAD(P)H-hydrate dehydratase n=1 Tax=Blattabacterium cuenoti TaxID=1653831 RepID=UPI00163C8669|nr:NAD(P)H-hydrate dehydratase [Blattabacterium cuenoti]